MGYVVALGAVAASTALVALVTASASIGNASILYLPAVLVAAVRYGRGPAVLAALASFVAYDWFFIEPRFHFTVADPAEWIALLLLLFTGIAVGQLAADQRARAAEAQAREREALFMYDVARLIAERDLNEALRGVAERLRTELGLAGAAIELSESGRLVTAGDTDATRALASAVTVERRSLGAGRAPTTTEHGAPGRWIRVLPPTRLSNAQTEPLFAVPLNASGARIGTITLLRRRGAPSFNASEDRLLSAAAAQVGAAVEREGLRREAADAEVLRRTDELRRALLNAVSHDLRTPLATVLAAASSLRQRDVSWSEPEREEFLASIEDEARRLDRVVGNLLDLSRIEAGSLRPAKAWHDVGALVDDVLDRLRTVTGGHTMRVSIPEDLPPVSLDPIEIDQVLSNLVENAVKYSPRGSAIEITVLASDGTMRFEVRDHGLGIGVEAERALFVPFRSSSLGARRGVGLGLAVAKHLVEAHGGQLWHERPSDGGARFAFTLPLTESE